MPKAKISLGHFGIERVPDPLGEHLNLMYKGLAPLVAVLSIRAGVVALNCGLWCDYCQAKLKENVHAYGRSLAQVLPPTAKPIDNPVAGQ